MNTAVVRAAFVLAASLAAGCSPYMGEPTLPKSDFKATLSGASEVPPTTSRGGGTFEGVYRPSTKVLEYRLSVSGLSGPVTMGYLHGPAAPGENAQQVAPINIPFYGSTISDGVTLTESQAGELLAGQWYVNVMTAQFPDGEIRGQIVLVK